MLYGVVDLFHGGENGLLIVHQLLMRRQFLDIDLRVETAEIEKRPISARSGAPDVCDGRGFRCVCLIDVAALQADARGCEHRREELRGRHPDARGCRGELALGLLDVWAPSEQVRRDAWA